MFYRIITPSNLSRVKNIFSGCRDTYRGIHIFLGVDNTLTSLTSTEIFDTVSSNTYTLVYGVFVLHM